MDDKSCAACTYSKEGEINPQSMERPLNCNRYPPIAIPLQTNQGLQILSISPAVQANDCCGEFSPHVSTNRFIGH